MKKTLITLVAILAIAMSFAFGTTSQVQAATEHCPDHNGHPGKVNASYDGELDNIIPPAGALICVKGGTVATGTFTADGNTTLYEYLGTGQNVSYYIEYSKPTKTPTYIPPTNTPTATATNTPDPEVTPTVTNTPDPNATPTNTPDPEPTETPDPKENKAPSSGGGFWAAIWAAIVSWWNGSW